jgi:phosphatidyl-myo-inositol dimannoside synthase
MKLAILTDNYPPKVGGIATHAYYISEYFRPKYDVHVITLKKFKTKPSCKTWFLLSKRFPRFDKLVLFLLLKFIRPDWIHICNAGLCYSFITNNYKTINRIVGNDFLNPWIGYKLPGRFLLNRIPGKSIRQRIGRIEKLKRQHHIRCGLENSTVIIANSEWTKKKMIEFGIVQKKIVALPGGVTIKSLSSALDLKKSRAQWNIPADAFVLLTVANLLPRKGVDTVIKVLPLLNQVFSNIVYLIVGDGDYKETLCKLAARLELGDYVRFIGKINHDKVYNFYQMADVYIQMSRDTQLSDGFISNAETMGRTFLEASAAAKPIVASNLGGIPSVVKDGYNGFLIDDSQNLESIASALLKFADLNVKNEMGRNGYKLVSERFSWQQIGTHMEQLMNENTNKESN